MMRGREGGDESNVLLLVQTRKAPDSHNTPAVEIRHPTGLPIHASGTITTVIGMNPPASECIRQKFFVSCRTFF